MIFISPSPGYRISGEKQILLCKPACTPEPVSSAGFIPFLTFNRRDNVFIPKMHVTYSLQVFSGLKSEDVNKG